MGNALRRAIGPIAAGLALALFASAPTARAQDAVRPQKPLRHEVTVALKLIQVFVADKDGRPIADLNKDDFILYDNGTPVPITDFERHGETGPAAPAGGDGVAAAAATPAPPSLLNRKFFFLFDFAYNGDFGIRKMGQAALHFLDAHVRPEDEVGVISISSLKLLKIELPLSRDHARVRDYAAKIGLDGANQRFEDEGEEYARNLKAGNPADTRPEGKLSGPVAEAPEPDTEPSWRLNAMTYVDCLTALAWALRSVQGQKNLLLFSYGIPYPTVYPFMPTPLSRKHENMIKEMQTSHVAISSLFTGGITLNDSQTGAWTLAKTASETGGEYGGNAFEHESFAAKIDALTASYYVLGFPVSDKGDGAFHALTIKVRRPGCIVRGPRGYSNPKPFARYSNLEKMLHLVDVALAQNPVSQAPLRFEMAALPISMGPGASLLLAATIPRDEIGELAGRRGEIVSLAFDATDTIAQTRRTEEVLARGAGGPIPFLSLLAVPPGTYRCRIVVRDLETGRAAVAGATAKIPAPPVAELAFLPPLLLRPERGAAYLKLHEPPAADRRSAAIEEPGLLGFDRAQYIPRLEPSLISGSETWAVLRCLTPGAGEAPIALSAFFYDQLTGDRIPAGLTVLEKRAAGRIQTFLVRLAVPEMEPDDYVLVFSADDQTSGAHCETARPFAVGKGAGKEVAR